jgi:hypothetical protein
MAKAIFDTADGRTFEFDAYTEFGGAMVCYSIYEVVRPKWKIFRTRYCDDGAFWISEYPTIKEGLRTGLGYYLARERTDAENRKKFEDFEKSLDK